MKWRLFRNKKDNNLFLNLKDTKVVSRPMAVLFSLVVAFICAALVFSIFIGGRWVYRKIAGNDQPVPTIVEVSSSPMPTSTPTPTPTPEIVIEQVTDTIPNTGPEPE
jgi:hypothetical protein